MNRALVVAASAALVVLGCSLSAAPAFALFRGTVTAAPTTYTSAVLQPPASASATCVAGMTTSTATVNWTASPPSVTTGYSITSTPVTTTKTTAAAGRTTTFTGLTKGGSYSFRVVATYRSWTSVARVTATVTC